MQEYHVSVLPSETIDLLAVQPGQQYIDATLGGGGHTAAIREKGGHVLGIDQDQDALDFVTKKIGTDSDLQVVQGNFKDIDRLAKEKGVRDVAGILFDLGVSSYQLDTPERGFSFRQGGPLDMRMDQGLTVGAKDLVNGLTERELTELFYKLGEEYQGRLIAKEIVRVRQSHLIETTDELEKIVRHALGTRSRNTKVTGIHPATKVFQAIRIAVNDELHALEEALPKALDLLGNDGRLVVISFHSMEDRIVKTAFKEFARQGRGEILTDKPITASEEEVRKNPRSRSAKLRVFKKTL